MMPPGVSFSPLQQSMQGPQQQGAPSGASTPVQDAIKLLSFKLPQNVGGGQMGALGGPGSPLGGQSGGALIQNWLQALLSGQQIPGMPKVPGAGPTPGGNPFQGPSDMGQAGLPGQTSPSLGINVGFGGQNTGGPSLTSPNIMNSELSGGGGPNVGPTAGPSPFSYGHFGPGPSLTRG